MISLAWMLLTVTTAATPEQVVRFDFETGDLQGWQVVEGLKAAAPMLQNANITLVIDNLEKRGLVHRQRHPEDRRMVVVSLTEAGRELIGQILPQHVSAITDEMSILTPHEQENLGMLCRKLGIGG